MTISFDLDQTIIPACDEFATEKRNLIQKLFKIEKIRKGTIELFKFLQKDGNDIAIYTTSYRSHFKIRVSLFTYGIMVSKIVNQDDNIRELKKHNIKSSKYPPAFAFDFHIDDSIGVGRESEIYKFKTLIIEQNDNDWCDKIKNEIARIVLKK